MSRTQESSREAQGLVQAFLAEHGQIPPCTPKQRQAAVDALCTLADQSLLGQPANDAISVAETSYRAQTGANAPDWLEWLLTAFSMCLEQQAAR